MPKKDEIRLEIRGKVFEHWEGITISRALDQVVDSFAVSAPFDPDRAELRQAFRPFGYQKVKVYLGDDLLLTGYLDKVEHSLSATDRKVKLQGRSLAGQIVDCSIDGPLEYNFKFLADLAISHCAPFGITVRWPNNRPIESARATYGQQVYDHIKSHADLANLFLYSSPEGEVVIYWGKELLKVKSSAALVEGESPLLSISTSFDGSQRFSKYKAASQYAGEPDIEDFIEDKSVSIHRPHLVISGGMDVGEGGEDELSLNRTARKLMAQSLYRSFSITATVSGWRDANGKVWMKDKYLKEKNAADITAVTLKAPSVALYKERSYIVINCTMSIDESQGRVTELHLVPAESLAGDPRLEVEPWVQT